MFPQKIKLSSDSFNKLNENLAKKNNLIQKNYDKRFFCKKPLNCKSYERY